MPSKKNYFSVRRNAKGQFSKTTGKKEFYTKGKKPRKIEGITKFRKALATSKRNIKATAKSKQKSGLKQLKIGQKARLRKGKVTTRTGTTLLEYTSNWINITRNRFDIASYIQKKYIDFRNKNPSAVIKMYQEIKYLRSDIIGQVDVTTSQADILTSPSIAWNRGVRQVAQTLNTTGHFLTEDSAGKILSKKTAGRFVPDQVWSKIHFEIIKTRRMKGRKK